MDKFTILAGVVGGLLWAAWSRERSKRIDAQASLAARDAECDALREKLKEQAREAVIAQARAFDLGRRVIERPAQSVEDAQDAARAAARARRGKRG